MGREPTPRSGRLAVFTKSGAEIKHQPGNRDGPYASASPGWGQNGPPTNKGPSGTARTKGAFAFLPDSVGSFQYLALVSSWHGGTE